jgi:flavin-dependent dehydrogenase
MNSINNIVIVGGGSAGWMTAAILIKSFPEKNITLIESPDIPIVGVGESTYDNIQYYVKFLGLDLEDFFSKTDASIKMGIEFVNFYKEDIDDSFLFTFGKPDLYGTDCGLADWQIKKYFYKDTDIKEYAESYFPAASLIKHNTFSDNENGELGDFNPILDTAFHFDAIKFGQFLKNSYSIPRGVKLIRSTVTEVITDSNGINMLRLDSGEEIFADLYIDCTGFKSVLMESVGERFISYNDLLPNNRAWATQIDYIDKENELTGVTRCTAIENGWCWNIPLWSRLGSGYVYSDKYVSSEDALKEFKRYILKFRDQECVDNLIFKDIQMRVGIYERVWSKNVVAIGLSAGFIEPLESNGLFTVHEFLFQLVRALLREKTNQWEIDTFNHETRAIYDGFVEFIRMHYFLTQRRDTKYWIDRSEDINDLSGYDFSNYHASHTFNLKNAKTRTFIPPSVGGITWISSGMNYNILDEVSIKLGEIMDNSDYKSSMENFFKNLDKKRFLWNNAAEKMPSMNEYLLNKYYNNKEKSE